MRHSHASRVAVLLFLVACRGPGDGRFESRVDSLFSANVPPGAPGCAVGIYRNGSVLLTKGYGLASLAERRPITPTTTFTLGSVSKQFTALAVLMLERDGRLSLDDDVRRHVPELRDYGTPIRIRDLLQHTSGIRDYGTLETLTGRHIVSMADFVDLVAAQRALNFTPQSRHGYSHSDYHLLAVVVERVTGEPFGRFLERTVLAPLGMTGSKVDDGGTTRVPERAYGYRVSPRDTAVQFPAQWLPGGSDLYTSVTDLARWDRNFDDATVGGRALIDRMTTLPLLPNGDTIPYAFGIRHGTYRGLGILARGSNSDGTRTEIVRFPAQRFTVAVLCNGSHLSPGLLGDRIADIYLEGQLKPVPPTQAAALPPAVPVTPAELERYVGSYLILGSDRWDLMRIAVRDGGLVELFGDTLQSFTYRGEGRFSGDGSPDFGFHFPPAGSGQRQKLQFIEAGEPGETAERREGPELWRPNAAALAEYAGAYLSEDIDAVWRVVTRSDTLLLRRRGAKDLTLVPVERDLFLGVFGGWDNLLFTGIQFHRDGAGRITHLTVSTKPGEDAVIGLRFDRYGPR